MYGLIKNVRKSTKVQSVGTKPERKERSFSTQLISQEKDPAVEINCPEGNGPEWFMHKDSLRFSQRARFHEEKRELIYRCKPAVLILTLVFLFDCFLSFFLTCFLSIS